MVYMNTLKCKVKTSERKLYNLSEKTTMCAWLADSWSRHKVHRVPISAPSLPQLLLSASTLSSCCGEGENLDSQEEQSGLGLTSNQRQGNLHFKEHLEPERHWALTEWRRRQRKSFSASYSRPWTTAT